MATRALAKYTNKQVQYVSDAGVPHTEVIERLRRHIQRTYGDVGQRTAAGLLGVHDSYLSEVLTGRRVPSPYLLSLIGIRRRKAYIFEDQDN